ncbi:hypothetical protein H6P81_009319 [Aristolochia fimbriata]|uniref:Uncharacterized protein n=1 Tax=Aristolochia fimbriata TaxID=158543 RepID=A0AAV7EKU4_ARIFI|nr:hypothetical protein H6P81_009319 [Aristolochia fimbriata]
MDSRKWSANSGETQIDVEVGERFPAAEEEEVERENTQQVPLLSHHRLPKPLLSDDLYHFRVSLKWCALDHSSWLGLTLSYAAFVLLAVAVPVMSVVCIRVPPEASADVSFDKLAQLPESALAAIGFFTLSGFFRRYGVRQLLFLDGLHEDTSFVRLGYARELDRAFRSLTCILLPSFAAELAHKIFFFSTVTVRFPGIRGRVPGNSIMFVALLASWVYRTVVFLLVCLLFRLTCELQILRLEWFRRALEEGSASDAITVFREHTRIKKQLLVTSHRYRIFILGCLVTITFSQLGALMLVLASKSEKNFFNSGDLVVCSAVQLSGFFMCLMGAARITHRAQGMVAIATRWHMLMTCASNAASNTLAAKASRVPLPPSVTTEATVPAAGGDSEPPCDYSLSYPIQATLSFESREALITYLQHNKGGITLFGFTLDRGLLQAIFVFEMSLVLWILSKKRKGACNKFWGKGHLCNFVAVPSPAHIRCHRRNPLRPKPFQSTNSLSLRRRTHLGPIRANSSPEPERPQPTGTAEESSGKSEEQGESSETLETAEIRGIKEALKERREKEKENLLSGVLEEVQEIEWPVFGKVLGTTGVVLAVITGSSLVLLTLNAVLAELSDRVFAGRGVQDFF